MLAALCWEANHCYLWSSFLFNWKTWQRKETIPEKREDNNHIMLVFYTYFLECVILQTFTKAKKLQRCRRSAYRFVCPLEKCCHADLLRISRLCLLLVLQMHSRCCYHCFRPVGLTALDVSTRWGQIHKRQAWLHHGMIHEYCYRFYSSANVSGISLPYISLFRTKTSISAPDQMLPAAPQKRFGWLQRTNFTVHCVDVIVKNHQFPSWKVPQQLLLFLYNDKILEKMRI